jgi:hypothetical protein
VRMRAFRGSVPFWEGCAVTHRDKRVKARLKIRKGCILTLLSNLKVSQRRFQNVTRKGYLSKRTVETRNLRVRPQNEWGEFDETTLREYRPK